MEIIAPGATRGWKWVLRACFLAMLAFSGWIIADQWGEMSSWYRAIYSAIALLALLGAVEMEQRVFVFTKQHAKVRHLFVWRTVELPREVNLKITNEQRIFFSDPETNRTLFSVGKEATRSGDLFEELQQLYAND